jgi:hypothetical protein
LDLRYSITSTQLNFLRKEGHIDFEDLYTSIEIAALKTLLDQAHTKIESGRDLHRENPQLLSDLHPSKLGQVAAALFGKKRLRIAFTQYGPLFKGTFTPEQLSSMTETCGGSILDLQTGAVTFYQADGPIDFTALHHPYLLIVFATDKARYRPQENDPYTHLLKRQGYGSGDLISDETHPLIHK